MNEYATNWSVIISKETGATAHGFMTRMSRFPHSAVAIAHNAWAKKKLLKLWNENIFNVKLSNSILIFHIKKIIARNKEAKTNLSRFN